MSDSRNFSRTAASRGIAALATVSGATLAMGLFVAPDRVDPPGVVKQRIHCLLQHPFLVAQDDVRLLDIDEALQTVVPDDHPAIEVVQIRRREPSAFQAFSETGTV